MALLYSAASIHYSPVRRQQHLPHPGPGAVPVVIHGTTYYGQHPALPSLFLFFSCSRSPSLLANPSPAALADPVYLSLAQSPRPVASSFAYNYSSSNIIHSKSQNQGLYSHGDRNRRTSSKQNSRPPRMFNRGPLNNTTNGNYPYFISRLLFHRLSDATDPAPVGTSPPGRKRKAPGRELPPFNIERMMFSTSMIPLSWLPEAQASLLVWFAPWSPLSCFFSRSTFRTFPIRTLTLHFSPL